MSLFNWFRKKKEQPKGIITRYRGNVIARMLWGESIDDYMYENIDDRKDICPICHNTLGHIPNQSVVIHNRNWDLSTTYDGYWIISEKFYDFCKEGNYKNLRIIPLSNSKGLYYFEPMDIFGLDYELYGTKYINKRDCCGSYDEIIKPPVIKAKDFNIESNDFIMKSGTLFGPHEKKIFTIIIGNETAKKMKAYGIKNIYFKKIYDPNGLKIINIEVNRKIWD
jgi:hypothetical protein